MRSSFVTIVTPAYNRASYLDETIRSVLTQDYHPIEYIVLDDGSTDNTREVLQKYAGRITWETHPNMGETRTVNRGWQMARGEIVAVVNSDDPLLPGAVTAAVTLLEQHPEVLVAYPDWCYIGPESEVLGRVQVPEYDYLYMLGRHRCVPGPGAFVRREAFELAGMRDPEFKYVADYEYWLRLGLYGPFRRIPKTLATFRVHPASASVSEIGPRMAAEHIRMMKKFYSLPNLPPEILQVRRQAFSWAHHVAFGTCKNSRREALRHYLKFIYYHPPNLYQTNTVLALRSRLPRAVHGRLRGAWRKVNALFRKQVC